MELVGLIRLVFVLICFYLQFPWTVAEDTDFCASVFETQFDHALLGHVMDKVQVADKFACHLKCHANDTCQSFNCQSNGTYGNRTCELNNQSRQQRPEYFQERKGFDYYGSVPVSCVSSSRDNQDLEQNTCHPGYKGKRCQTREVGSVSSPGHSCKQILDLGDSRGDGEYWIDPEHTGNPLKVYCDMTTDGGGWLLISNVVITSHERLSAVSVETSYRGISNYHNNRMVITASALNQLRRHVSFTQLRFHCNKQQGRTFHVATATNSTGEAVVQYFSGQTDVMPDSCHSFLRMKDDNSLLAAMCQKWGYDNGVYRVGKWGASTNLGMDIRVYEIPAFVGHTANWMIKTNSWMMCDDNLDSESRGDFWKIYAR